jgi:hypothetical protein
LRALSNLTLHLKHLQAAWFFSRSLSLNITKLVSDSSSCLKDAWSKGQDFHIIRLPNTKHTSSRGNSIWPPKECDGGFACDAGDARYTTRPEHLVQIRQRFPSNSILNSMNVSHEATRQYVGRLYRDRAEAYLSLDAGASPVAAVEM